MRPIVKTLSERVVQKFISKFITLFEQVNDYNQDHFKQHTYAAGRCWPRCICIWSATSDQFRSIECVVGLASKACHAAVEVSIGLNNIAIDKFIDKICALCCRASTTVYMTAPGDFTFETGWTLTRGARLLIGIYYGTLRCCVERQNTECRVNTYRYRRFIMSEIVDSWANELVRILLSVRVSEFVR